jgi:hypothetical protein
MLRQLAILSALVVIAPGIINAQNPDATKGLEGIDIVVEHFNKVDLGFSREDVESQVLVGIKRDLPKLPVGKQYTAYIYVRISGIAINGGFVANVSVQLRRPSRILRENQTDTGIFVIGTVWDKGAILAGPASTIHSQISEEISEGLTEFAANYYRENP